MANLIPLAIADVELQLAAAVSVGSTTLTLNSANDDDGNALPAGMYCFTLDSGTSNKEYLIGQLNGVNVTSVKSVSRQGVETTGAARSHRVGAPCIITNFATLQRVADILRGQLNLDGASPISYDAEPTLGNREELATVGYVLDTVNGGTVVFDQQVITGNAGEAIVAGNLVYFKTSDQEWYKTDADTLATVEGVQLGIALGTGSDGAAISGGIQIAGTWTTTGLTAGSSYYVSNTAGAIASSAGTTSQIIGLALSTTKLLIIPRNPQTLSTNEKAAVAGGGNFGTPGASNKFVTEDFLDAQTTPIVRTYTVTTLPTNSATQFDITNPSGTTYRYTWDGGGTNPGISSVTVPVGASIAINSGNINIANRGIFTVTGSGTNYFEVTNASGTTQTNTVLDVGGSLKVSIPQTWTKPAGLKYITIKQTGGGAGGAGADTDGSNGIGKGGASAGYAEKIIAASSLGATETINIGLGGAQGTSGATPSPGKAGGTTTFGSHVTTTGGTVTNSNNNEYSPGGTATGGDLNLSGQPSTGTVVSTGSEIIPTSKGGDTPLGRGGYCDANNAVSEASGYGSGGYGEHESNTTTSTPGAGADGVIILTEYYS